MFNRFVLFLFVIGVLSGFAQTTSAAIYKWVNENGVVSYQDSPPPVGFRAKVVMSNSADRLDADHQVRGDTTTSTPPVAVSTPVRHSVPKVEIYVTSWCGYCRKAKNFFTSRGIAFIAYDIEKDRAAAQRKTKLSAKRGVPLVVINGQVILGFSEAAYAGALDNQH